jgi:general L-amino acid transport system substrate-binding protein
MLRVLPITLRVLIGAACLFTTLVGARAATLDRVREQGMLRCGGVIRPGLAFPAIDHSWHGLEIEMCRAIATAVLGAEARIEFHPYVTDKDFGRLADGHDDVAFLTGGEIFANQMFIATLPGPAVFYQTTRVMVRGDNPAQHVADLRGSMICAEPGTGPERSLQAYMLRHAIPFQFSMWQELEEMIDAFSVGRCPAVAGEETALAALLLGAQADDNQARLLPEALSATPVLVATGPDPVWAGIAGWVVQTVLTAERQVGVQGPRLPMPPAALGLAPGWQARVVAAVGPYAEIVARTLGAGSPLGLAPGLNASWDQGGLFAPPTVE